MIRHILLFVLVLANSHSRASPQGYGNVEDDSAPSNVNQQAQQQISSLPQYDASPPSYDPAPQGNNLQQQPQQSPSQDFWWMNQNAFQKPAGHPGVEPSAQTPQQQPQRPNPVRPNNFQQQQQPQANRPRPQQQQQPYRAPQGQGPRPNAFPSSPGSGWNAPAGNAPVATPECMLVNKADCHQPPVAPPQNYRPPPLAPQQPEEPQPAAAPVEQARPPPQFYQPPSPQPQQSAQPYYNNPQQSQNYQQQPNQFANPQGPFNQQQGPVSVPRPVPQSFRPQPQPQAPQQQQQYNNRPAQPQPSQPQNYQQQQQNQHPGGPVIGPIDDQSPYPGCPAAMLCVQEDTCNVLGIIQEGLRLSDADKAHRVALSRCSEPSTGVQGICCRDPNYKDPWPDMNGNGGKGGDHHHHHPSPDQGSSNNLGQFQQPSGNAIQSQPQPAQGQGGGFRNPYSVTKESQLEPSSSHNFPKTVPPSQPSHDPQSQLLSPKQSRPTPNHYEPEFQKCLSSESCVLHFRCKATPDLQKKKCNEDIFKNAYHCCKSSDLMPRRVAIPQPTTTQAASIPTTPSPFANSQNRFLAPTSTKAPELPELPQESTPAAELESTSTTVATTTKNTTSDFSSNSTMLDVDDDDLPVNRTKEILQTFWNLDNQLNETLQFSNATTKVDVQRTPVHVPLKEELLKSPPFGFIFKDNDLYVPELELPAQFFRPPRYEIGERQYPVPEDFPSEDEDEKTTTITADTQNEAVTSSSLSDDDDQDTKIDIA